MSDKEELIKVYRALGYAQPNKIVDLVQKVIWDELREEFIRVMTVDSETRDRRRRDFNESIFDAERGFSCWTDIDLGMVLAKYDQAVRNLKAGK